MSVCAAERLPARQCPDGAPPPCRAAATRAAAPPAASVAVLYFDSRSRDSNDLSLADGITEEIITRLAGVARLTVRSRHVVQRYRGTALTDPGAVARTLNVAYLVTGSLRRAGGRLRLAAELIRADGGTQVWGGQFDQAGEDVFAIQEAVANEVATGIIGRLLPSESRAITARSTNSTAAFEALARANFQLARRDSSGLARAIEEYQAALRFDPGWIKAVAGLAMAYGITHGNGIEIGLAPDTLAARAMRSALEATQRAPNSSEAWTAMGIARVAADPWRQAGARDAFERAVALDSSNAEAHHLLGFNYAVLGLDSMGLEHDRRALNINPRRPVTYMHYFQHAMLRGRYAEARRWMDTVLSLDPNFPPARAGLMPLLIMEGDTARARALFAALPPPTSHRATSRAAYIAMVPALLGDVDGAMAWLEAAQPRGVFLQYFMRMRVFDRIREQPRFARLFREVTPA